MLHGFEVKVFGMANKVNLHNARVPSLDPRKYLLGLSLNFLNALVPTETHSYLKLRENRLDNVLHAIGPSESQTIYVWPPH